MLQPGSPQEIYQPGTGAQMSPWEPPGAAVPVRDALPLGTLRCLPMS